MYKKCVKKYFRDYSNDTSKYLSIHNFNSEIVY